MKKVLLVLAATIVCTLSALGQAPRQLKEFKQVTSGTGVCTWQERHNSAELNGKYHIVKDAQTYFLVTFKNGLQDGVEERYKYNALESRTNYVLGLQCGKQEAYSTSAESRGKLIKKCSYNNKGQLDGTYTMYFTNGKVQSVRTYRDGKVIGDEYHYTPDGKVLEEYHIYEKSGKTYKSSFSYSNERGVAFIEEYTGILGTDGHITNKVGEYKETWHTGQLKMQAFYTDQGAKTGVWKEWFIDGTLKSETGFDENRYEKTFFRSGSIKDEKRYDVQKKCIASLSYYESGKPREEVLYNNGTTTTKQYYDDGKLREESVLNDDGYEIVKEYHRNGKLRMGKEKSSLDYTYKITECYDDKGTSIPFIQL